MALFVICGIKITAEIIGTVIGSVLGATAFGAAVLHSRSNRNRNQSPKRNQNRDPSPQRETTGENCSRERSQGRGGASSAFNNGDDDGKDNKKSKPETVKKANSDYWSQLTTDGLGPEDIKRGIRTNGKDPAVRLYYTFDRGGHGTHQAEIEVYNRLGNPIYVIYAADDANGNKAGKPIGRWVNGQWTPKDVSKHQPLWGKNKKR